MTNVDSRVADTGEEFWGDKSVTGEHQQVPGKQQNWLQKAHRQSEQSRLKTTWYFITKCLDLQSFMMFRMCICKR